MFAQLHRADTRDPCDVNSYAAYLSTPRARAEAEISPHLSHTEAIVSRMLERGSKSSRTLAPVLTSAAAMAGYVIALAGGGIEAERFKLPLACCFADLHLIHVVGIRWFGRMQVIMSALKCLALLVLIVPGLLYCELRITLLSDPWLGGFGISLLPLFFAYGFESIAQTASEVKDSTRRLPKILLRGISITAVIYVLTSIVSFGVLPGGSLLASNAPMAEVASIYLPAGAAAFVTLGAIAAIMTALNGTILVPSRLALMFVQDGLAPRCIGFVNPATATPIRALTLTLIGCAILLVSGQISLALNVAVFALVVLYFIHSLVFLCSAISTRSSPVRITIGTPRWLPCKLQPVVSLISMGVIAIQVKLDVNTLRDPDSESKNL